MPTNAPDKPRKETWRDWSPEAPVPPELLTRDELVSRLRAEGVSVTPRDLLFWQKAHVLPYPIKRRRDGVTRAYYPPWVSDLVQVLRASQAKGETLEKLRYPLRTLALQVSRHGVSATGTATAATATAAGLPVSGTSLSESPDAVAITIFPDGFDSIAADLARIYQQHHGTRIRAVEIRLIDERGNPIRFDFPTTSDF